MENLKSLQEGGPEVIDETKQIAEALTKMVNEQEVPLDTSFNADVSKVAYSKIKL